MLDMNFVDFLLQDKQILYHHMVESSQKAITSGHDLILVHCGVAETRNAKPLTIQKHLVLKNSRLTVKNPDYRHWNLHIHDVQESDRGGYMCQVNTVPMKSLVGFLDFRHLSWTPRRALRCSLAKAPTSPCRVGSGDTRPHHHLEEGGRTDTNDQHLSAPDRRSLSECKSVAAGCPADLTFFGDKKASNGVSSISLHFSAIILLQYRKLKGKAYEKRIIAPKAIPK
ncbi:ig-like domain-containing protein [Caerostris extrusa]|uniref:Ig-like domain-containing protein n=1 Tax=Caerostris extrusa TaxID=172846 RepID=A0AAV4XK69_CAEEX|nr:ig-like domain-containing protein [Caerostris extrusa]